jgi:hypothetical protein
LEDPGPWSHDDPHKRIFGQNGYDGVLTRSEAIDGCVNLMKRTRDDIRQAQICPKEPTLLFRDSECSSDAVVHEISRKVSYMRYLVDLYDRLVASRS